mmetsp:Transcript_3244/g.12985  ORF Transcript_3244/g.12985 Transcript_3244/m.12985 type:complete len:138 (-) Transcript_3244:231-644(-)|eukprot:scaffold3277_cov218-Pinguiococcus_pyrenoidosus.AAC.10
MGKNFERLRNMLETRFPALIGNISAEVYPPPPMAELAAQITGYLQLFLLACLFMGKSLFRFLGFKDDSPVVKFVEENKTMLLFGCFALNNIAANLTKTGAFEILVDDQLVFSKLEAHRFPRGQEILDALSPRMDLLE